MSDVANHLSDLVFDLIKDNRAYCNQLYWLLKHNDYDIFYSSDLVQLETKLSSLYIYIKSPLKDDYEITIKLAFRTTETYPRPAAIDTMVKLGKPVTAVKAVLKCSPVINEALAEIAEALGVARI